MSADLELLALAAKAIGATEYGGCDDCRPPGVVLLRGVPMHYEGRGEFGYAWNPRDDDGDALRLAVKLNLIVGVYGSYTSVAETYDKPKIYTNAAEFVCWHHETAGCAMAATRLAVLRASTKIGRAIP